MTRSLTAADRSALIRLASTMPAGSPERRAILAGLSRAASEFSDPHMLMQMRVDADIDEAFGAMGDVDVIDDDTRFDRKGADLVIRVFNMDVRRAEQLLRALERSRYVRKHGPTWDVEDLYNGDILFRADVKDAAFKTAGGPNTEAEWQEFLDMQERHAPPAVYHQYVREYHAWQKKSKGV